MRLELRRPFIDLMKEERRHLNLREHLTGGDVLAAHRHAPNDAFLQAMMLAARVAGLEMVELESMDMLDVDKVIEHVGMLQEKRMPKADPSGPAPSAE